MTEKLRLTISAGIIWLIHISGIIGISLGHLDWFITKTPLNLLVIFILVVINFPINNLRRGGFFLLFFVAGYLAEWLGVHYGYVFGSYSYGENLGWKIAEVPVLIGINWAVLVMVTGALASAIFSDIKARVLAGASFMVLLDIFMEGVAPIFDFWEFAGGVVPFQNYVAWFGIAAVLHALFQKFIPGGNARISLHVYAAQLMFFIYFFLQYAL
jgi:putative membrane protein